MQSQICWPYISSNISGQRQIAYDDPIEYGKIKGDIGIGLNYDFSPSSSIEATINPDFSQIEADETQIDINSSFALDYPELRPFFNKGMDLLKFMDRGFYSRTINSPSFASKFVNLGRNSGTILLNAVDEISPYLIGGEDKSYNGNGGSFTFNQMNHFRTDGNGQHASKFPTTLVSNQWISTHPFVSAFQWGHCTIIFFQFR